MRRLAYLALALLAATPASARGLPAGFVYLRDVAPSIAQDMRYAGADNFTGHRLPGYDAAECVLRRDAALALARVEVDLAQQHLGLKTYDCYRPVRAVNAFWRWAHDRKADGNKRFYPRENKLMLFSLGYIAAHSKHSTGTAVDLTLIALPAKPAAPFDRAQRYGPCTAPASARAPNNAIDMGTGFDCLDVKSHTRSAALTPEQRHWREVLKSTMARRGFRNYFREWWHYEFIGGAALRAYDFPIAPRGGR